MPADCPFAFVPQESLDGAFWLAASRVQPSYGNRPKQITAGRALALDAGSLSQAQRRLGLQKQLAKSRERGMGIERSLGIGR